MTGLDRLLNRWKSRAADALPSDAMLVNKHIRELREVMEARDVSSATTQFLLSGARFKLSFIKPECDACGATHEHAKLGCFAGYEEELDGRWVALVPAENDMHLARAAVPDDYVLMKRATLEKLVTDWNEGSAHGSPNHAHTVPGIWDDDNGELAGQPCAECAAYDEARALLGHDMAPWTDRLGNILRVGDTIQHPTGETAVIHRDDAREGVGVWRAVYANGESLFLGNQIGDRGLAVRIAAVRPDVDCSGTPASCPNNEGRGCECSDKEPI